MIDRVSRLGLALLMPVLLTGCFLAPGKFTSNLTVNADRSFTYSYVGEVYGFDPDQAMKGMGDDKGDDGDDAKSSDSALRKIADQDDATKDHGDGGKADDRADDRARTDAKNREIAAALSREQGFRKVDYVGDNKFLIDYRISGKLDHTFLFPYNLDAGIIIPFVAIEVRANGTIRVKAPGFANDNKDTSGFGSMAGGASKATSKLDGVFTLDTDAEIVSQNNEDGAQSAGGRKTINWKATPLSSTPPMAVLRLK